MIRTEEADLGELLLLGGESVRAVHDCDPALIKVLVWVVRCMREGGHSPDLESASTVAESLIAKLGEDHPEYTAVYQYITTKEVIFDVQRIDGNPDGKSKNFFYFTMHWCQDDGWTFSLWNWPNGSPCDRYGIPRTMP